MGSKDSKRSTEQKVNELIEEVKQGGSVEITTKDDVREYLGIDDPEDHNGTAHTHAEGWNRTVGVGYYLIRVTGQYVLIEAAMHDREHGTTYHIEKAGDVEFEGYGVDKQALLDDCQIDGIDENHAETVDQHISKTVSKAAYEDGPQATDGSYLYMETVDRSIIVNRLRRKIDYSFTDSEWDNFKRYSVYTNIKNDHWDECADGLSVNMVAKINFDD